METVTPSGYDHGSLFHPPCDRQTRFFTILTDRGGGFCWFFWGVGGVCLFWVFDHSFILHHLESRIRPMVSAGGTRTCIHPHVSRLLYHCATGFLGGRRARGCFKGTALHVFFCCCCCSQSQTSLKHSSAFGETAQRETQTEPDQACPVEKLGSLR